MNGLSLRNLKPLSVEERAKNAENNRQVLDEYKKASQDIHQICQARGLPEPVLVA